MLPSSGWSQSPLTLILGVAVFLLGDVHLAQQDGQEAFSGAGCSRCHSVEVAELEATVSDGMRGPNLGSAVADHDADWLKSS